MGVVRGAEEWVGDGVGICVVMADVAIDHDVSRAWASKWSCPGGSWR